MATAAPPAVEPRPSHAGSDDNNRPQHIAAELGTRIEDGEDPLAQAHSFSDRIVWNIVFENELLLAAKETARQELAALRAQIANYRSVVEKLQRLCPPNSFPLWIGEAGGDGAAVGHTSDHHTVDKDASTLHAHRMTDPLLKRDQKPVNAADRADDDSSGDDDEDGSGPLGPQPAARDDPASSSGAVLQSAVANLVDTMERFNPDSLASCLQDLPHALSSISLQLAHIRGLVTTTAMTSRNETKADGAPRGSTATAAPPSVHQLWLTALDKMADLIAWVAPHARSTTSSTLASANAIAPRSRSGSLSSASLRKASNDGSVNFEGSDLNRMSTSAAAAAVVPRIALGGTTAVTSAASAGARSLVERSTPPPPSEPTTRSIGGGGGASRKRERSQDADDKRAAPRHQNDSHMLDRHNSDESSTTTPSSSSSLIAGAATSRERKAVAQSLQQPLLATLARTSWSPRPSVKSLLAEFPLPAPPPPPPTDFPPRSTSPARLVRRRGSAPHGPAVAGGRSSAWKDGSVASWSPVPPTLSSTMGAATVNSAQWRVGLEDVTPPLREIERNTSPKANKIDLLAGTAAPPPIPRQRAGNTAVADSVRMGGLHTPPITSVASARFLLDSPPQGREDHPLIQF